MHTIGLTSDTLGVLMVDPRDNFEIKNSVISVTICHSLSGLSTFYSSANNFIFSYQLLLSAGEPHQSGSYKLETLWGRDSYTQE